MSKPIREVKASNVILSVKGNSITLVDGISNVQDDLQKASYLLLELTGGYFDRVDSYENSGAGDFNIYGVYAHIIWDYVLKAIKALEPLQEAAENNLNLTRGE